jgi:DNA-directed RNA polymerase subunit M
MEFCSSCGKRMVLKSVKDCSVFVCPVCKLEKSKNSNIKTIGAKKSKEKIVVIRKEDQELKTNPTTKINCPKCENNLAFTWQVQTRSGDEGATQFFRCTKCNHTFRLYS